MKGGENRPDNCPPCPVCPVCEGKINEPPTEETEPKPEKKGFFANLFGNSENKLQETQDNVINMVKQGADDAKNKSKSVMNNIMQPINKFVEPAPAAAANPEQQLPPQPQGQNGGRGRRRKQSTRKQKQSTRKQKQRTRKRSTPKQKHSTRKHSTPKHLKKRTTPKKSVVKRK